MMNEPDTKQHQANQTIYLVEADKLMRERIASLYTSSSCSVMTYTCAEDFLEQSGIVAGCLVLGIEMPGMSTVELMQELKHLDIKIPIIVLGDREDLPKAVKVMRAGALDFIGMPFTNQRLKISIEKMLP
jgi:two-component system C4-dicarboxylate transport response regulator DctD